MPNWTENVGKAVSGWVVTDRRPMSKIFFVSNHKFGALVASFWRRNGVTPKIQGAYTSMTWKIKH